RRRLERAAFWTCRREGRQHYTRIVEGAGGGGPRIQGGHADRGVGRGREPAAVGRALDEGRSLWSRADPNRVSGTTAVGARGRSATTITSHRAAGPPRRGPPRRGRACAGSTGSSSSSPTCRLVLARSLRSI